MDPMIPLDDATLLFWKRYNAASRVRAMVRLEQAISEAQQAVAAITNDTPGTHPARELLAQIKSKLYADAGYQGPKFQQGLARACREVNVEIVRHCDTGRFVVLPKRVRRSAPNRRTHHRLAEPLPAPEQGLGVPEPKRPRLPALGVGSIYAAKALTVIDMILDRLKFQPTFRSAMQQVRRENRGKAVPHGDGLSARDSLY
jgi:hypothetical protein